MVEINRLPKPTNGFLDWSPHYFFAVLAGFFGLILVFLTPPFQAPDEYAHFYRAYQVSEGGLISVKENQRVGGYLPISLKKLGAVTSEGIPFNPEKKMSAERFQEGWNVRLNQRERAFIDFNNTALISFVPYSHQAAAISLGRFFTDRPLVLFYIGRFSNLVLWFIIAFWAIRIIPIGKWILFAVFLMPMNFFLAASMSYDAFTNAAASLIVALTINYRFEISKHINLKQILFFSLVALALSLSKFAYMPLVLLFFIIPVNRFPDRRTWLKMGALVLIPSLIAWAAWSFIASNLFISFENYHETFRVGSALVPGVEPLEQFKYVLQAPLRFIWMMTVSLVEARFWESMIARLGWLDTSFPGWFIFSWVMILGLSVAVEQRGGRALQSRTRIFMFFVTGFSIILFHLLLYMQWNHVGASHLSGVQGRYFIPVLPLFLISCLGKGDSQMESPFWRGILLLGLTISCLMVCLTLINRYYIY